MKTWKASELKDQRGYIDRPDGALRIFPMNKSIHLDDDTSKLHESFLTETECISNANMLFSGQGLIGKMRMLGINVIDDEPVETPATPKTTTLAEVKEHLYGKYSVKIDANEADLWCRAYLLHIAQQGVTSITAASWAGEAVDHYCKWKAGVR